MDEERKKKRKAKWATLRETLEDKKWKQDPKKAHNEILNNAEDSKNLDKSSFRIETQNRRFPSGLRQVNDSSPAKDTSTHIEAPQSSTPSLENSSTISTTRREIKQPTWGKPLTSSNRSTTLQNSSWGRNSIKMPSWGKKSTEPSSCKTTDSSNVEQILSETSSARSTVAKIDLKPEFDRTDIDLSITKDNPPKRLSSMNEDMSQNTEVLVQNRSDMSVHTTNTQNRLVSEENSNNEKKTDEAINLEKNSVPTKDIQLSERNSNAQAAIVETPRPALYVQKKESTKRNNAINIREEPASHDNIDKQIKGRGTMTNNVANGKHAKSSILDQGTDYQKPPMITNYGTSTNMQETIKKPVLYSDGIVLVRDLQIRNESENTQFHSALPIPWPGRVLGTTEYEELVQKIGNRISDHSVLVCVYFPPSSENNAKSTKWKKIVCVHKSQLQLFKKQEKENIEDKIVNVNESNSNLLNLFWKSWNIASGLRTWACGIEMFAQKKSQNIHHHVIDYGAVFAVEKEKWIEISDYDDSQSVAKMLQNHKVAAFLNEYDSSKSSLILQERDED